MKHMKKAVSLLLALVMALGLVTTAGAADTVTVTNNSDHSYTAYQIFSGTHNSDAATLYDVEWGKDLTVNEYGDISSTLRCALSDDTTLGSDTIETVYAGGLREILYKYDEEAEADVSIFKPCYTAGSFARVLSEYGNSSPEAMAFARIFYRCITYFNYKNSVIVENAGTTIPANTTNVELKPGYYLIVDNTTAPGEDDARNLALLQVTGKGSTITISSKTGVPTVEKYVRERSKSDLWTTGTWGKTADAGINNPVWFRLVGTMPENYDNFLTYKYVFHDTLGEGITLSEERYNNSATFAVFLLDSTADEKADFDCASTTLPKGWTKLNNGYTFAVDTTDIQKFTVTFDDLKTNTAITKDSKILVFYCADMNEKAVIGRPGNVNTVKLEYSSDPNYTENSGEDMSTSFTTEDTARVFTYKLDITKIDGATAANDVPTTLSGAVFRLYFLYDNDGNPSTEPIKRYIAPSTTSSSSSDAFIMKADAEKTTGLDDSFNWTVGTDGKLVIKGLDADTYYLEEVTAPAGYNTLDEDIKIEIDRTLDDTKVADTTGAALTSLTIKIDDAADADNGDLDTGVVSMKVANLKGATLPETGGIGTTLFYVIGGVLVAGAAVVLITRKRVRDGQ